MPYRCVHCSALFEDGSKETLQGCSCGSKFFFYIKEEKLREILQQHLAGPELSEEEKQQIEADVRELAGLTEEQDKPIFLDFESVKVIKPGKYLLDLARLFGRGKPRVYQLEDGKYVVDLSTLTRA